MQWIEALNTHRKNATACVLATILHTQGSTPRGIDAKMVISSDTTSDTIGGGAFEARIIDAARKKLRQRDNTSDIIDIPLGPELEQCCGGYVGVLLEPLFFTMRPWYLFGAGHIGQALAPMIANMHYALNWYDSREQYVNQPVHGVSALPLDVGNFDFTQISEDAIIVILTHDHAIDYALLRSALTAKQFAYIGVIGSNTKKARFQHRLEREGIKRRFECPIGTTTPHNLPMEIAISIAADINNRINTTTAHAEWSWNMIQAKH